MLKKIMVFVLLLTSAITVFVACSGGGSTLAKIAPTWINATISGEKVSIPVSEVEKDGMTHFTVTTAQGKLAFMAYKLGDQIYARANICPPCRSEGFFLAGDRLVCETCGTVFDAKTGKGISGACVAYPKAQVAFTTSNGNITMTGIDLVNAFEKTVNRT